MHSEIVFAPHAYERHIDVESAERYPMHFLLDGRRGMHHTLFKLAVVHGFAARAPLFVLFVCKLQYHFEAASERCQMWSALYPCLIHRLSLQPGNTRRRMLIPRPSCAAAALSAWLLGETDGRLCQAEL
jgi:hypothetical protein